MESSKREHGRGLAPAIRGVHIAADAHQHRAKQNHQTITESYNQHGDDLPDEPAPPRRAENQVACRRDHAREGGEHQHQHQRGVEDAVPVRIAPYERLDKLHAGQVRSADLHRFVRQQPAEQEAQRQAQIKPWVFSQAVQIPPRADEGLLHFTHIPGHLASKRRFAGG